MKKLCGRILSALLLLTAAAGSGRADETAGIRRVVSLVTLDNYAPFCFARSGESSRGREVIAPGADSSYLQGYSWEVVREAFHAQGYYVVLDTVSWDAAEAAARRGGNAPAAESKERSPFSVSLRFGTSDVLSNKEQKKASSLRADLLFPAVKTTERREEFTFSEKPVDWLSAVLYLPAASRLQYDGLASLSGKRVGVVRGWSFGRDFDQAGGINKIALDDTETGFRLLRQGRLDALAGYGAVYDRQLQKIGWERFFRKQPAGATLEEYLCGARGAARTAELLRAYSAGLAKLSANGRLAALAAKWKLEAASAGAVTLEME